jgi:hypothetical protein
MKAKLFTEVERPHQSEGGRVLGPQSQAVINTAKTGRAVRIVPNGQRWVGGLYNTIHNACKRHGLRLRSKKDGDGFIVWAELKK